MSNEQGSPGTRSPSGGPAASRWRSPREGAGGVAEGHGLALLRLQPLAPSDTRLPIFEARWWLTFGWPLTRDVGDDAGNDAPWVRRIALEGVRPAALCRVRVSLAEGPMIDLGSVADGRGGQVPAGELMASMGIIAGLSGLSMVLPTDPRPVRVRDVAVELWLAEPQPACRVRLLGR